MNIKYFSKAILALIRLLIFAVTLIISFPLYFFFIRPFHKDKIQSGFDYRSTYLTFINYVLGIRSIVKGKPSVKPALYVSNHRGLVDFFVNLKYLDAYIISKAEVEDIPILGYFAKFTGIFYLERKSVDSRKAARIAILQILQSGRNVLIYPEGTTNIERLTKEFRIGAFEVAIQNGFPVVPVAMEYKTTDDLWKNTSMASQFVKQLGKYTTQMKTYFGDPIYTDNPRVAMEQSREWIDNTILEMQKNWSEIYK